MSWQSTGKRAQYTGSRGGSVLSHNGRTWYYRVVRKSGGSALAEASDHTDADTQQAKNGRALLDDYSIDSMGPLALVVCMMDPSNRRLYTVFRTVADYYTFTNSLSDDHKSTRCFFEICFNDRPQRLRFDIDIEHGTSDESERILGDFLQAVERAFIELHCPIRSIAEEMIVCTSHGPAKISYHVVFTHAFVRRCEEAKAFYLLVVRNMKPEYQVFVDVSVYSKTQQFRLLGFSKVGANRPKICPEVWRYRRVREVASSAEQTSSSTAAEATEKEEEIVEVNTKPFRARLNAFDVLRRTLISFADTGYPISIPCQANSSLSQGVICSGGSPNEIVGRILAFGKEKFEQLDISFPFEFVGSSEDSTLVLLRRTQGSHCPTCSRAHEHENPFLRAVWRGDNRFDIMFDCRRASALASTRQYCIGSLELPSLRKLAIAAALQETIDSSEAEESTSQGQGNTIAAWRRRTIEQALRDEVPKDKNKTTKSPPTPLAASRRREPLKFVSAHPSIVELLQRKTSAASASLSKDSSVALSIQSSSTCDPQQVFIVSDDMDVGDGDAEERDAEEKHVQQDPAALPPSESVSSTAVTLSSTDAEHSEHAVPWKSEEQHRQIVSNLIGRIPTSEQTRLENKLQKLAARHSSDLETRFFTKTSTSLTAFWKMSSSS